MYLYLVAQTKLSFIHQLTIWMMKVSRKSGFQRWNANFKLTQKINKKLTADFDLRYSEIEINGSGFGNATSAYTYRPVDNPLGMLLLPLDLVKVIQIWKKLVILCIT